MAIQPCRSKCSRSEATIRTFHSVGIYGGGSHLPVPEERIRESIHTGQCIVEQSVFGTLIPALPGVPERAVRFHSRIRLDALQVEATVVDAVAIFSGETDTEACLARKNKSTSP